MKISGLQKLTLLDYPDHLAAIVFLPGCNFRCPFCQNSPLVLPQSPADSVPSLDENALFHFLNKRAGILDGVCITGGEPTLQADLPDFIKKIRSLGYLVKLDTNGSNPDMLEELLSDGLLDYAAMDIKAGRDNYANVCGLDARSSKETGAMLQRIERSVRLLKDSAADFEFRTTVVRGLHTECDFADISDWLSGCSRYFLQSFRDCPQVLLKQHSFSAFSPEEMAGFLSIVQKKIPQAALRG